MTVPRRETLFRGTIEVGGTEVVGDLVTDGTIYAVFQGAVIITHLVSPEITFADGAMVITAPAPNDDSGAMAEWRIPQPEAFHQRITNVTLKKEGITPIKGVTIQQSQYRVHVTGKNTDLSFPGAKLALRGGKRVILHGDEIFMVEAAGGCGCGKK